MTTSNSTSITAKLLGAESVFYKDGLPESEYMEALANIHDCLHEIGADHWKYGNVLKNMSVRLEENGAFEYSGHDEALAELSRLIPISFHTINRLVLTSLDRHELIGQLVDSFVEQVFDITEIDEPKFSSCLTSLCDKGFDSECAKILHMLIFSADERFNELKKHCFHSILTSIAPKKQSHAMLKKWIVKNSGDILNANWSKSLLSRFSMSVGIELYENKMQTLGESIMRISARTARSDELIIREKLTGIAVSKNEAGRNNQIMDVPLMSYLCWTANTSFDFAMIKEHSFNGKLLVNAIGIAAKHTGSDDISSMMQGIKTVALNTMPQSGLTDILDRYFFSNRKEHEAFIHSALLEALGRNHDEMSSILIVSKIMERHKVSLNTAEIVDKLNASLIDELSQQRNTMKYLCMFNASFISLFSEDVVISCLEKAATKASGRDITTCMGVIPEEIVMKVDGLKRARLSNDLGL